MQPMTQTRGPRRTAFDLQGHRGARGLWPENTLAGFARTLALGVSALELDCAVCRDGVAVISHDPRPNPEHTRGADGQFLVAPGPLICTLDHAGLAQYDVGRIRPGSAYAAEFPEQEPVDGERIPRLSELFDLAARLGDTDVRFNIEAKLYPLEPELSLAPEPFVHALLEDVRAAGLGHRATIQSFDWRVLRIVKELEPALETGALTDQQGSDDTVYRDRPGPSPWLGGLSVHDFGGSVPRLAQGIGAGYWSPNYLDLSAALIDEAHELGLRVIPWTVNAPTDMARLVDWGVDGLISDRPDHARAVLGSRGIPVPRPLQPRPPR
jgi:glycerophosphoryl diester phosphodiesterase